MFQDFGDLLSMRKHVAAKALITFENATAEQLAVNFVWLLCKYGDDDPDMLVYLVDKGCPFILKKQGDHTCLSIAAKKGKHKIVKKLLDLGVDANEKNHYGCTSLQCIEKNNEGTRLCAMHLLDAGAAAAPNTIIAQWISDLANQRKATHTLVILLLGLQKCCSTVLAHNGKDVLRMIARVIWSHRSINH